MIHFITHCYRVHSSNEAVKTNKVYDHTCIGMTAILKYRRKTAGKDKRYVRKKVEHKCECVYSHSQSYVILDLPKLNVTYLFFLRPVQTLKNRGNVFCIP